MVKYLDPAGPESSPRALTHEALIERLRPRFGDRGWALLKTVANRLGGPTNYADAVSLSLYRSRGLELHGFEAKVSRADFLHELKSPAKAEAVARYCDRWWLVLGDAKIADPSEVPAQWGILVAHGNGLREVRPAAKLQAEPLDRAFIAALLVRAAEHQASQNAVLEAHNQGYAAGRKSVEDREGEREGAWRQQKAENDAAVKAFEEASGVKWWPWRAGQIGAAVKVVLDRDVAKQVRWLHGLVAREERNLRAALKELGLEPEAPDA